MRLSSNETRLGAHLNAHGACEFLLWAPFACKAVLSISHPMPLEKEMMPDQEGYFFAEVKDLPPGSRYQYRIYPLSAPEHADPLIRPDPASRSQPDGVHGPSQVVAEDFQWQDAYWHGLPLTQYIIYEAHVGTMTAEGTLDGMIACLDDLKQLGITALELMPVAQFPGARNWGYDGVYPFAVQNSYGGVEGLKRLVDACHRKGLAVIMDVVYNHLGPEGNYLADFGPYFTDAYRTPWGAAINFDGTHSTEVRRYFIENALYWITECRIDALRLDAVHAIYDFSAVTFLEELGLAVEIQAEHLNRNIFCIAESALNDTRIIRPRTLGGFSLDAQWNDDFHHALHALLTGERSGYYADFGELSHMAEAWREGYVYNGQYSRFRLRPHGNSSRAMPARQMVVFAQNHDQVGNRMNGERLSRLVSFDQLKTAAASVLLSPFLPLLFMGEEYAEPGMFPYFVSHQDPNLVAAVREGRRKEFNAFLWQGEPPDPQAEQTFAAARLNWHLPQTEQRHACMFAFHQELIRLRKSIPCLAMLSKKRLHVLEDEQHRLLCIRRWWGRDKVVLLLGFNSEPVTASVAFTTGTWHKRLDAADERWQGKGSTVAEVVVANGPMTMDLPPFAVLLWQLAVDSDRL